MTDPAMGRPVLVVAYLFPPLGGPGVQRTLGFVRHLPRYGYAPTVLASTGEGYWAEDTSLLARVPSEIEVHRWPEGALGRAERLVRRLVPPPLRDVYDRALLFPDRQAPWGLAAVRKGYELARGRGVEAVYATGAPWTNLVLGATLARGLGLPLVTDYRDPWTDGAVFDPITGFHRRAHRELEGWVHQRSAWVIANTAGNLDEMQASFPVTGGKSSFIPNGWDELDFGLVDGVGMDPGLVLGHAGNFYPGREADRALELFAAALSRRPDASLRLRFLGHGDVRRTAERVGLGEHVEVRPYLPLREALAELARCRASLVVLPPDAGPGWVPQKLYQSLRLPRPMLTLAPPGEAAALTREAGQPWVDVTHPEAAMQLAEALERIRRGEIGRPPAAMVARYDRRSQAGDLARILDRVIGRCSDQ